MICCNYEKPILENSQAELIAKWLFTFLLLCTGRGRPKIDVTDDQIRSLFSQGFTAKAMAKYFGCSASYVHRYTRLHNMGLRMRERYSNVSDPDLNQHVAELQNQFPNCGTEVKTRWQNTIRVVHNIIMLTTSDNALSWHCLHYQFSLVCLIKLYSIDYLDIQLCRDRCMINNGHHSFIAGIYWTFDSWGHWQRTVRWIRWNM